MTWDTLLQEATLRLELAGVEDPALNAEYLAMKVRGFEERHELRPKLRDDVTEEESEAFELLLARREAREPIQYILGEWEFFGLPMLVGPAALIPRPETEILVEETLKETPLMGAKLRILDIGTGSGAIALALATQLPEAEIVGIDINPGAIDLARANAERLGLTNVRFRVADIMLEGWADPRSQKFDLVVSNPPYVSLTDFATLEEELRLYEPREALTDEATGLTFYKRIAEIAPNLLTNDGRLLLELGFGLAAPVSEIVHEAKMKVMRVVDDLAGIARVLVAKN